MYKLSIHYSENVKTMKKRSERDNWLGVEFAMNSKPFFEIVSLTSEWLESTLTLKFTFYTNTSRNAYKTYPRVMNVRFQSEKVDELSGK